MIASMCTVVDQGPPPHGGHVVVTATACWLSSCRFWCGLEVSNSGLDASITTSSSVSPHAVCQWCEKVFVFDKERIERKERLPSSSPAAIVVSSPRRHAAGASTRPTKPASPVAPNHCFRKNFSISDETRRFSVDVSVDCCVELGRGLAQVDVHGQMK